MFRYKTLSDLLSRFDYFQIDFEYFQQNNTDMIILFEQKIDEFNNQCKEKRYVDIIEILFQLLHILDTNFSDIFFVLSLVDIIEKSNFLQNTNSIIQSKNLNLLEMFLIFLISFSYASGDFMEILIDFFVTDNLVVYMR